MPIYAYKCSACGHTKDALQKISDDPLTQCPACGAQTFSKQVTAAGFQLKGSGWYVSDFRSGGDGANSGVGKAAEDAKPAKTDAPASAPAAGASAAPGAAPSAAPAPAPPASAKTSPAATPAPSATKSVASPAS